MWKKLTSLAVPIAVLAVLLHEAFNTPFYTERELAVMRERATEQAKAGEFEEALKSLRALTEIVPKDEGVWSDYLSVLTLAGRDAEAVTLARGGNVPKLRDYALAALFEAALRSGAGDSAQYFAQTEILQSDKPESIATARAWALYDAKLLPQARAVAAVGLQRSPASQTLLALQTQLQAPPEPVAAQGEGTAADAVSGAPAHEEPIQAKNAVATSAAAAVASDTTRKPVRKTRESRPAAEPAPERAPASETPVESASSGDAAPAAPTASAAAWERRDLAAEQARNAVRDAESAPLSDRGERAGRALSALDRYLEVLAADFPDDTEARRNALLDRVRALTLAGRLDEAATTFEGLGDSAGFPVYGLLNGADVYSLRHQPERAERLISQAAAQAPDDATVIGAQFYNALDLEQYPRAALALERLRRRQGETPEGRVVWTDRLAAMFEAYQNRLGRAQAELEALRAKAPEDPEIRLNLATVYRWRGWTERSLDEYRSAQLNGADSVVVRAGAARALMDAHRYGEVETKVDTLLADAPENPDVVALKDEWKWVNSNEYSAQFMVGKSNGSAVTGDGDAQFEQWLRSRPLAENYRVFAHQRYDWGDFPVDEDTGGINRFGIGGDYRSQYFDVALEATKRNPGTSTGANVSGEWRPDDHWSLFGEAQSDSTLVPLRALRAGIDGDSATVGVRYRWNESRVFRISATRSHFSDSDNVDEDNDRESATASLTQTLWQDARHKLALTGEAYYSHNSASDNVPYYNPKKDRSFGLTAEYVGILSRRFERSWSQRVAVGAGDYWQEGHGNSSIWDVTYEQRWRFGPSLELNLGGLYRSRVYDGDREGYGAIFGGINWRF